MIGSNILNQIRNYDRTILAAWGTKEIMIVNEENEGIMGYEKKNLGYLSLKVNGIKFKGKVIILLMPDDTYTIITGIVRKARFIVKNSIEQTYANDFVKRLDEIIEGI